ncbi:hypothetical protein BDP27DRAFT_1389251 [Rhodocollybia butyracea]|uniref:Uncharacterized protein n=1 Tax=Rhodocollybia butyracea TaxID=206335 RepID=A0A9P5Q9A1_9AGAR|nr:hypothetical protein BDP27DRAFT_1389251 [Rhodocollybia butyracea]
MSTLVLERSIYVGNYLSGILYGIEAYLFAHSVFCLWSQPHAQHQGRAFYVTYGAILLLLTTLAITTNALFGQEMWIEHRDSPGGPIGYFAANVSAWYNTLGSTAGILTNFMADGLLLYRCYMIWGSRIYIILLPCLIYLASIAMAILNTILGALPGANVFRGKANDIGIGWVSLTISLNIILSTLICARLLIMRRRIRSIGVLSPESTATYSNIIAIIVESAVPYTFSGIALLVTSILQNNTELAWSFTWGVFSAISPQMIILRVAMGQAWNRETVDKVSRSLSFARPLSELESGVVSSAVSGRTHANYEAGNPVLLPPPDHLNGSSSDMDISNVKKQKFKLPQPH